MVRLFSARAAAFSAIFTGLVPAGVAFAGRATFTVIGPPGSTWVGVEGVGVSRDGAVVACNAFDLAGRGRAFRWTRQTGPLFAPGEMSASALSPNGRIVFGQRLVVLGQNPPLFEGFAVSWLQGSPIATLIGPSSQTVWNITAASELGASAVLIGFVTGQFETTRVGRIWPASQLAPPTIIPQPGQDWTVYDTSNDGRTLVGQTGPTPQFGGDARLYRPYVRDLSGTSFTDIRTPTNAEAHGEAIAISGNGAVVAGRLARGNSQDQRRAFIWTRVGGTRFLAGLADNGESGVPRSLSLDGARVVGEARDAMGPSVAVAWMDGQPATDLANLLRLQGAAIPADALLTAAFEVSDDGRAVVGNVRLASGPESAFIATFATPCPADLDDGSGFGISDGGVTSDDLLYFLARFEAGDVEADLDDGSGMGRADGGVTIEDLLYFLARFAAGC